MNDIAFKAQPFRTFGGLTFGWRRPKSLFIMRNRTAFERSALHAGRFVAGN